MRTDPPERPLPAWHRWAERDRSWSRALHRCAGRPALVWLLVAVSRAADGGIWYAAMLALPWLGGERGTACALRMLTVALVNLVIYKIMKRHFARPRPYVACPGIRACTPSLDEHSFPSGHVMHAVGFSALLSAYFPWLAWWVWPFTALVALSRVALGLHYPSDVLVGAAMGWFMAFAVLALF